MYVSLSVTRFSYGRFWIYHTCMSTITQQFTLTLAAYGALLLDIFKSNISNHLKEKTIDQLRAFSHDLQCQNTLLNVKKQ